MMQNIFINSTGILSIIQYNMFVISVFYFKNFHILSAYTIKIK